MYKQPWLDRQSLLTQYLLRRYIINPFRRQFRDAKGFKSRSVSLRTVIGGGKTTFVLTQSKPDDIILVHNQVHATMLLRECERKRIKRNIISASRTDTLLGDPIPRTVWIDDVPEYNTSGYPELIDFLKRMHAHKVCVVRTGCSS